MTTSSSTLGRILLIDNDKDVSDVVASFLARTGHDTAQAPDGTTGLAMLEQASRDGRPIDVVLLDLRMPEMSGDEVLAKLAGLDEAPSVVIVSGFVDDGDRARLLGSPLVHAIVKKPFDLFELGATVRAAIGPSPAGT